MTHLPEGDPAETIEEQRLSRLSQVHPTYRDSVLTFAAAPEYTTGEVLISSVCRRLGLATAEEAEIDLELVRQLPERLAAETGLPRATWDALLADHGALRSPTFGGQRPTRQLPQLTPLVPAFTQWSGVLGKPRHRWVPGELVFGAIAAGTTPDTFRPELDRLRAALMITPEDDVFAQFLEAAFRGVNRPPGNARIRDYQPYVASIGRKTKTPPERLVQDLSYILELKSALSRRHWLSLVEATMRLGVGAYVLWMCRINESVWRMTRSALSGEVPSAQEISNAIETAHLGSGGFFDLEAEAVPAIRRTIRSYAEARFGINSVLWHLQDSGHGYDAPLGQPEPATPSAESLRGFLRHVEANRAIFGDDPLATVRATVAAMLDQNAAQVSTRKGGPFKNLYEFTRYVLGQIRPSDETRRPYDQAYLLATKGKAWILHPGPVALFALIHCAGRDRPDVPVTLDDFRKHLGEYGIRCPPGSLERGETITRLTQLGVLLDSPDAVGGRVLVDPFRRSSNA